MKIPIQDIHNSIVIEDNKELQPPTIFQSTYNIGLEKEELLNLMLLKEKQYYIEITLITKHKFITIKNRYILLKWMLEVIKEFDFNMITFEYSVYLVDKYVSTIEHVEKDIYQLIGVTAIYMASKIEVIFI